MSNENVNDKPSPENNAEAALPEIPVIPQGAFGQALVDAGFSPVALGPDATGCEMIDVAAQDWARVASALRNSSVAPLDLLVSVSGVDWKESLQAVYHLYATSSNQRLAVKVTAQDEKIPSVVSVWPTADWHERETYDLFGILFEGHPNLARILMPSDWLGFPMRKDYKVEDPRLVWNER